MGKTISLLNLENAGTELKSLFNIFQTFALSGRVDLAQKAIDDIWELASKLDKMNVQLED
jgi:hypothetical protein